MLLANSMASIGNYVGGALDMSDFHGVRLQHQIAIATYNPHSLLAPMRR